MADSKEPTIEELAAEFLRPSEPPIKKEKQPSSGLRRYRRQRKRKNRMARGSKRRNRRH